MRMKRSKFITFVFSLVPGAGHMYMGFMKTGISLMTAFTLIIFLASWLNISPLLFIMPVLWFFSFFDCMNRRYSSDEDFTGFEDNYLFSIDRFLVSGNLIFKKRRLMAGILLLILGVYLIWNNLMHSGLMDSEILNTMRALSDIVPQIILGVVIIVIGIKLVLGRKKERDYNA